MSTVLIHCQDISHEAKRVKIAEFSRSCYPCEILECEAQGGDRPHLQEWGIGLGNPGLDDQNQRRQVRGYDPDKLDKTTWRYRLECSLCGLNVTVSEATLPPILTTLADAGVSDVSLGALAARVVGK